MFTDAIFIVCLGRHSAVSRPMGNLHEMGGATDDGFDFFLAFELFYLNSDICTCASFAHIL